MKTLKSLQTQIKQLKEGIKSLVISRKNLDQEIKMKENQIKQLEEEIKKLQNKEVIVSEHAMLRYIERVIGIDMETIKSKILTDSLKKNIETFGNGTYPVEDFKVVVKNNVVVTVEN